ncbi:MAG: preprotein translocase subunit SecA [Holosporaceae bacterium]|jgi:preprotein translocase subunit SecA|nr:preprotein translocase subunit SecA [Holosporaceae bacterium]
MLLNFLKSIFGSHNDRVVKKYLKVTEKINAFEASISTLSDDQLREKTTEFKRRLMEGETLDDILPEAFAVVREASRRTLGLRPFDVQMVGAQVLHHGMIAEMKTGEGKTLVASMAVYLNALEGKGVHVVTVNDYLARRDAEWMGKIYQFLGLTVGIIVHGLSDTHRKEQYACDVTYATNNELGFDYLRDNMKFYLSDLVMRPFNYAIVDEVDSILIDEARTPLIISGAAEDSADLYMRVDSIIPLLFKEDYEIDEKHRSVTLTEAGNEHIENLLYDAGLLQTKNLYDIQNIGIVHHANQALKAHHLFKRDVDYIVKNGKVIIIDEFTGRMMEGRRYSDGLHQAIEAKERVNVEMENQTLASITFQNFFRMYKKLSGMTGTAETEAQELSEIYKVETLVIPTNVAVARKDLDDEVYRTANEKYNAIVDLIRECNARNQPVLVGTVSIEKSEHISAILKKKEIPHNVLNARYHDVEAQIIADAGMPGAVTIATNMAGRGTDIKLGGNLEARLARELADVEDETQIELIRSKAEMEIAQNFEIVKNAGGLYVVGTERHESRRIDNQLRGRSGRQGDPGASKFFLSLEDDLMRIFGAEKLDAMLLRLGIEEGEAITHPWVNKALEKAQKRVEARNYDIRKHLLKFDDVMNDQRKVIYAQRYELMSEDNDFSEDINEMRRELIEKIIYDFVPDNTPYEFWDLQVIDEKLAEFFGNDVSLKKEKNLSRDNAVDLVFEQVTQKMQEKENSYTPHMMRYMEKSILLRMIDQYWKEHLLNLDRVRQGINLRAYAQRDPLNEYKQEAFSLFETMCNTIREETVKTLSLFELSGIKKDNELDELLFAKDNFSHSLGNGIDDDGSDYMAFLQSLAEERALADIIPEKEPEEKIVKTKKPRRRKNFSFSNGEEEMQDLFVVSRNAPCPCGSGLRYKNCCGKIPSK